MENQIVKTKRLKAPISRVWRALTDHKEFGEWFGVNFESAFKPGKETAGQLTISGLEHITLSIRIMKMDPKTLFSYTWHPYAVDPNYDYSQETPTHVTFQLEDRGGETDITVTESGFENVPADRRVEAFRMNTKGWEGQMENIKRYVEV